MIHHPETALMKSGIDDKDGLHDQLLIGERHPVTAGDRHVNRIVASLRGRYHWALLLGVVCAALGGLTGYVVWIPRYESIGLIQVAPSMPRVLYKTEESTMMPMYDGFIRSQMDLIQSRRVIDYAMDQPEWKALGQGRSEEVIAEFRAQLMVERAPGSQVIKVSYAGEDPKVVEAAVKSVIEAYSKLFIDADITERNNRQQTLESLETDHTNKIKAARQKMQELADTFDAKSLELVYQANLTEEQRIELMLKDIEVQAAGFQAIVERQQRLDAGNGEPPDAKGAARDGDAAIAAGSRNGQPLASPRTSLQIAADRNTMTSLLQQKTSLETELGQIRHYYSESHPRVLEGQKRLAIVNQLLQPYEQRYNELTGAAGGGPLLGGQDPVASAQEQLVMFEAQKIALTTQLDKVKKALKDLVGKIANMDDLKADLDLTQSYLQRTKDRIDEMDVESTVGGRIEVISPATSAGLATNLGKRKQLVVLGFMGGLTLGVGLIVLVGLADRRCRFVAEAQESIGALPLIGVLPQLPTSLGHPEQAAIAAHAVQQIRMQLQLSSSSERTEVVVVTSPMPGDGKTSLTMALGLSYAASRSRTLLIDFDLYGRGLTRQSECIVREKIGSVLLREGLVTKDQLAAGLERAATARCCLGEALVQLGVASQEDVTNALALQARSMIGLHDVLEGAGLEECVHPTDTPLLSILPVGESGPDLVASLSPASVGQLLDQARQQYKTIIIDTGPVPASTEASIVASQCDSVVLTVSQGVQQRAAERAVAHLGAIGAHVAGVVFNRAKLRDMEHSGFSSGASSRGGSSYRPVLAADSGNGSLSNRFGPVPRAAALVLPPAAHDGRPPAGGDTVTQQPSS